jgi:hypothetical protein
VAADKERGRDPSTVVRSARPAEPVFRSDPATRAKVNTRLDRLAPRYRVRQDGLWPFLLIRDFLGDDGKTRLTRDLRQSPDLLVVPGDVATLAPASLTDRPRRNEPHTVFVHVWNLGRLPAFGAQLSVLAFASAPPGGAAPPPELVGTRYLDLPDRGDPACHAVFRLPALYRPAVAAGTQVRLTAQVSCLLDLCPAAAASRADRHQADRRLIIAP